MSKGPEQRLSDRVRDWAKCIPQLWAFKVHGSRYQRAGVADWLFVHLGVSIHIELKVPLQDASPLQQHELRMHAKAGGESYVCSTLESVKWAIMEGDIIEGESKRG